MDERSVIRLYTAQDNLQADMIIEALKNEGIPAYKKDEQASGFLKIYAGFVESATQIYIAEEDADRAKQVLENMGLE